MASPVELSHVAEAVCSNHILIFIGSVGQGTFKETFHVKNKNGISFALKLYKNGLGYDRSTREIQAMRKCNHPGIAKLLYVDQLPYMGENYLYTIEEYLGGGTLSVRLTKCGLLDRPSLISLGSQLIDAVSHIANHNLVHRDLKPENILFRDGSFSAVITDFGIVRDLSAESLTKSWLMRGPGTYYYASPEQLNNEKNLIDWRTDQFSLGILLSISIFGIHPFQQSGYSINDTVEEIANRGNTSNQFKESIRKTDLAILEKMVDVWPARRYLKPEILAEAWHNLGG